MERKSNRVSYGENRAVYYDKVVQMFAKGMTAKEILKSIPIGKSTIYRWYDEYCANNAEANMRKSPKLAMQTIAKLSERVRELEAQLREKNNSNIKYKSVMCALEELGAAVVSIQTSINAIIAELKNE